MACPNASNVPLRGTPRRGGNPGAAQTQIFFRGFDIAENGKVKEAHQLLEEEENEEGYTWSEQFDIRAFNQTVIAPHAAFFPWFKDRPR